VNVVPLVLRLTERFHTAVMSFFFPGKDADDDDDDDDDDDEDSDDVLGNSDTHAHVRFFAHLFWLLTLKKC